MDTLKCETWPGGSRKSRLRTHWLRICLLAICTCPFSAVLSQTVTVFVDGQTNASNIYNIASSNIAEVAIEAFPPADKIIYSLDNTDPLSGALVYSGPFFVSSNVTVRAVASYGGSLTVTNEPAFVIFGPAFSLTTSASTGGAVWIVNGPGPFSLNTTVTLVASNSHGYTFGGWVGDVDLDSVYGANTVQLVMNRDRQVRAVFEAIGSVDQTTAGGPIRLTAGSGTGQVAYVQVHLGPPDALIAGAGWLFSGQTNYSTNANFTVAVLSNQTAQIDFKRISNWATPASVRLTVPLGQLTVFDANYRTNIAFVQVQFGPPQAIAAGGGWRFVGQTPYITNDLATAEYEVTGGSAAIEFKPVPGWVAPPTKSLSAGVGATTVLSNVLYSVTPPSLSLNPSVGLQLSGTTGTTYRIEYCTNLVVGDWQALQTNTLGGAPDVVIPWPLANFQSAFYRAVWLP